MVEMLVAVAIVAILAAMLMPALGKAKSAANMGGCIANLRQIGAGIFSYTSEHDGYLPPEPPLSLNGFFMDVYAGQFSTAAGSATTSYGAAYYYGPTVKTWICPGDNTMGGLQSRGATNGVPGGNTGVNAHSYAANRLVLNRRTMEIPRPAQSILMTDFQWGIIGTRAIWPHSPPWSDNFPTKWHNGIINCLFVDGHVEPLRAETIKWGGSNTRLWYADYPSSGLVLK